MMSEAMMTISVPVSLVKEVKAMVENKTKPLTIDEVVDVCDDMLTEVNDVINASVAWNSLVGNLTGIVADTKEEFRERRSMALYSLSLADGYLPGMILAALTRIRGRFEDLHARAQRTATAS